MTDLHTAFTSPETKRRYVRALFATIAHRYDFITVVLSYGRDRRWKARLLREAHVGRGQRVLDLACGTGDLALGASRHGAWVVGLDITPRMVEIARAKAARAVADDERRVPMFIVGDMMAVPLPDQSVDLVTTGYGLRNVPDLADAVTEIARVLRPGGRLLALDFNRPDGRLVRTIYLAYLTVVGATLGWLLHGDADTYRYIPESIARYPGAHGVARLLRSRGFDEVRVLPLLAGLMTLHVARKGGEGR